jgi:hypothetical protein
MSRFVCLACMQFLQFLTVPKREIFVTKFFTLSDAMIWVGYLET